MNFIKFGKEKDFEFFVKALPLLEPVEFAGLAKILGIKMVDNSAIVGLTKEKIDAMSEEARAKMAAEATRPMDEVLEKMMDRYLELPKRRRKEINDILKEIKEAKKNEVTKNGATA